MGFSLFIRQHKDLIYQDQNNKRARITHILLDLLFLQLIDKDMQGFTNFSQEVPHHFVPQPNTPYRIVSIKEPNKAFTVVSGHHQKLCIGDYIGDPSQRFTFALQGNKFALIVQSTNSALYIPHHNHQNGAEITADSKQHKSNWFDIVRVSNGEFANRGYHIITLSGKSLDLEQASTVNGNKIHQWEHHNGWNQVWLIVPADQPLNQGQGQWGGNQSGHSSHGHHHSQHGHHKHKDHSSNSNQGFNVQMEGIFKKNYTYALVCAGNQSKCLQVAKDGHIVIADFNGNIAQKYIFQFDLAEKKYHIKATANLQYLVGPGMFAGADIVTKPQGQKSGASWTIEPSKKVGKGFNLRSFTGHTIDVPASNYSNGTRVQKHGFHGGQNQTFLIIEK